MISDADRVRVRPNSPVGPKVEGGGVQVADGRAPALDILAPRGQAVHVQPHRRIPHDVARSTAKARQRHPSPRLVVVVALCPLCGHRRKALLPLPHPPTSSVPRPKSLIDRKGGGWRFMGGAVRHQHLLRAICFADESSKPLSNPFSWFIRSSWKSTV